MGYRILVPSYTNAISTIEFDPQASTISVVSSTEAGHQPSWVTQHPDDPSLLFAGLEQTEGEVVAIKYDSEWKGEVVARISSGGADPCSLLAHKAELFVANYSSGTVSVLPISTSPPYFLADAPTATQLVGSGPNAQRQESSHAHQVYTHNTLDGVELLVPDLGSDKVWRFGKSDDGSWKIRGHVAYPAGAGPRHVAAHDGQLFTVLELTNEVAKYKFPLLPGEPQFVASAPTVAKAPPSPHNMLASEILVPLPNETFPEVLVYVSNRNDPSPEGDAISIYTAEMEQVAEVRTGLNHIRGMTFGGAGDKWLIAGGVNGGGIAIFERVDGGRQLKKIATKPDLKSPTGFLWV
ncbi:hypothetical protein HGRIS_001787 [Hohenbuehelia grisea]|uniref:Isomerase YbhE n=1 Tax=Hohenbuehelia grisea TaxID=104357 RepID=A0ABR3JIG8_9AGAR